MEQAVGSNAVNAENLGSVGHVAGGMTGGLSPMELFLHASFVVKLVMLGLVLASILVWAIIIAKVLLLRRVNREGTAFEDRFWAGGSLDTLYETEGARPVHPMAAVFGAAMGEWRRSSRLSGSNLTRSAVHERIDRAIEITILRETDRLSRYLTILATIGPVAPFVGLFGTVWGIMHAFTAIAGQNNTSLAVVAPGISEALFATALGLLTAIPAYVAYNMLNHSVEQFGDRMDMFGTEFSAILSRQSEERKMGEV